MALINCHECKKEISSTATACPGCGAPVQPTASKAPAKKTRPVFKVLGGLIALLFLAAIFAPKKEGGSAAVAETSNIQEDKRAVVVTAAQLFEEYQANEVSADQKYKGQKLEVTGNVASINKDITDSIWVGIETSNPFMPVHAAGIAASQASGLSKGQKITVSCSGRGMIVGSPMLKDCVFVGT